MADRSLAVGASDVDRQKGFGGLPEKGIKDKRIFESELDPSIDVDDIQFLEEINVTQQVATASLLEAHRQKKLVVIAQLVLESGSQVALDLSYHLLLLVERAGGEVSGDLQPIVFEDDVGGWFV